MRMRSDTAASMAATSAGGPSGGANMSAMASSTVVMAWTWKLPAATASTTSWRNIRLSTLPRGNVDNLMLRQDVVDAVAAGSFHVHAMTTVDDAIALMFAPPEGPPADVAAIDAAVSERIRIWHEIHAASLRRQDDDG